MRRPLSETLAEVAAVLQPGDLLDETLHVVSGFLDLPVEVRLRRTGDELELLADLPSWRWQDGFTERPGHLRLSWQQEAAL